MYTHVLMCLLVVRARLNADVDVYVCMYDTPVHYHITSSRGRGFLGTEHPDGLAVIDFAVIRCLVHVLFFVCVCDVVRGVYLDMVCDMIVACVLLCMCSAFACILCICVIHFDADVYVDVSWWCSFACSCPCRYPC